MGGDIGSDLVVEAIGLTKRFGRRTVVDHVDLSVPRGCAFGYLGPNGAGKTTTIRMLLGLTSADEGGMRVLGHPVPDERSAALARVGAMVEEPKFFDHLSGRRNLEIVAAVREPDAKGRIDGAMERVGLRDRAHDRVGRYSTGMRQRLGVARCLLADPELLILDEPANGLDPPGIKWMRELLRSEAARGRAVLVSSHLLSEVSQSVDDVVVISRGELRASGPLEQVLGQAEGGVTRVRARDRDALGRALSGAGLAYEADDSGALLVRGAAPETIGEAANEQRVALSELVGVGRSLEEVFFELTGSEEEE
jgi:ABC-2 type transport system ATP-binding protein